MDYRLPTTVVPSRYDIRLEPDLDAATFAGHETVAITVSEPVGEILLNAAELVIRSVSVQTAEARWWRGAPSSMSGGAGLVVPQPIRSVSTAHARLHGISTIASTASAAPKARRAPRTRSRLPSSEATDAARLPVPGRRRARRPPASPW
jgi:hypothetical protein